MFRFLKNPDIKSWPEFFNKLLTLPITVVIIIYLFQLTISAFAVGGYLLVFPPAREQVFFIPSVLWIAFLNPAFHWIMLVFLVVNYGFLFYIYLNKKKYKNDLKFYAIKTVNHFMQLQIAIAAGLFIFNIWEYFTSDLVTRLRLSPLILYMMLFILAIYYAAIRRGLEATELFTEK